MKGAHFPSIFKTRSSTTADPHLLLQAGLLAHAAPQQAPGWTLIFPRLISLGLKGMIGKGKRSQAVKDAIKQYRAVYFGATGGAGALLSKSVVSSEVIAYEDLGPEAVVRLGVVDMPLFVINDIYGSDLYETGTAQYKR